MRILHGAGSPTRKLPVAKDLRLGAKREFKALSKRADRRLENSGGPVFNVEGQGMLPLPFCHQAVVGLPQGSRSSPRLNHLVILKMASRLIPGAAKWNFVINAIENRVWRGAQASR